MKRLTGCLITLIALLFCSSFACAESHNIVDLRETQQGYGAYIAQLNSPSSSKNKIKRRSQEILVLLKTDGFIPNPDDYNTEQCIAGPGNRYTMLFPSEDTAKAAIKELQNNTHILYAELDQEVTACDTAKTADMEFLSYGAEITGFSFLNSWARHFYRQSTVAVVDSGIYPHELISSRLINGYDYVDNDDNPENDEYGHGTHVAGIIADCTRDTSVSLYSIRVLNAQGRGKASNTANGILEAAEAGISVINLSFVSSSHSALIDDAVQTAVSAGCTVVTAAGNSSEDTAGVCPAHLTDAGVIVVGAADKSGNPASYSNYGTSIDCYMYGSGIYSCASGGGYESRSGTSQATPHISAACSLLAIIYGNPSPAVMESTLKALLVDSSTIIPLVERLVPQKIPCHLDELKIGTGEMVTLPVRALPLSCNEKIVWSSSDETVAAVKEGRLTALNSGTTCLTGVCSNFDMISVIVQVTDEPSRILKLPVSLKELSEEAFEGTEVDFLEAGDQLLSIKSRAFESHTILLCSADSYTADYAEENGYQYIAVDK